MANAEASILNRRTHIDDRAWRAGQSPADRIMRLIATVVAVAALLATVLAACGSSSDVDVEKADDSATAPGGDSSTSGSVADESSGGEGDSDGELLEAETTPAGHEESFIESRRENLYEPEHVGGAGESALRAAGCEVFGSETWICPDETNLSGADLSGMSLPFARMRGALLFGVIYQGLMRPEPISEISTPQLRICRGRC